MFNARPSTKNYIKFMELMHTDRGNTVFIGDQLFTDVWEQSVWDEKYSLADPSKERPQIVLKRYLEKIVLHFYKKENEKRMSCK